MSPHVNVLEVITRDKIIADLRLELAEVKSRLALAERVVEAAMVVILGNHACVEKRAPYGCAFCDALRAALAAWREGEP